MRIKFPVGNRAGRSSIYGCGGQAGREGVGSHASDGKLITLHMPQDMTFGTHREVGKKWVRMEFDRGRLPFEIVLPFVFSGPEVPSLHLAGRMAVLPM